MGDPGAGDLPDSGSVGRPPLPHPTLPGDLRPLSANIPHGEERQPPQPAGLPHDRLRDLRRCEQIHESRGRNISPAVWPDVPEHAGERHAPRGLSVLPEGAPRPTHEGQSALYAESTAHENGAVSALARATQREKLSCYYNFYFNHAQVLMTPLKK